MPHFCGPLGSDEEPVLYRGSFATSGFIAINLERPRRAVVQFVNKTGRDEAMRRGRQAGDEFTRSFYSSVPAE
jgi:hypothetical protein